MEEAKTRVRKVKMVSTFIAKRNLDIGNYVRAYDELVPEAPTWLRFRHLVNTGMLREIEVPEAEYVKAVQKYCPELASELAPLVNISIAKLKGEQK